MKKTIKFAVATITVALATTVGMAAPADAAAPVSSKILTCC